MGRHVRLVWAAWAGRSAPGVWAGWRKQSAVLDRAMEAALKKVQLMETMGDEMVLELPG